MARKPVLLEQDEESFNASLERAESVVEKIGKGKDPSAQTCGRGIGCGYVAALFLSGLVSAGVAFWVGLPQLEREAFVDRAFKVGVATASFAQNAFRILLGIAPPPPDFGAGEKDSAEATGGGVDAVRLPPPPAEDSRVRLDFVNDLAGWVVSCYSPPSKASLCLSFDSFRSRCAQKPGESPAVASPADVALAPGMVRGLYNLYADRFVDAVKRELERQGKGRGDGAQELYSLLFSKSIAYANAFEALSGVDGLRERALVLEAAQKKRERFKGEIENQACLLQRLVASKASEPRIQAARGELAVAKAGLLAATQSVNVAKGALLSALARSGLDETESVALVRFAAQKADGGLASRQGLLACAEVLRDLSKRFDALRADSSVAPQEMRMSGAGPAQALQGGDVCFCRPGGGLGECLLPLSLPDQMLSAGWVGGACLRRPSYGGK